MKLRNLMWGACACALMAGCSNDDVVKGSEENLPLGEESYVAIRLVASNGSSSRATSGGFDNGFNDEGQVDESVTVNDSKVAAVDFYFYRDGQFSVKGQAISGTDFGLTNTEEDGNIESYSNVVVVLKGVTQTPNQVLAVLNGKNVDLNNLSLKDAMDKLVTSYSYDVTTAEEGGSGGSTTTSYFLMSNSAYLDGTNPMYATPIETRHLQSTEDLAKANPVDIYVERVAAKVQLNEDANFEENVDDVTVNLNGTSTALTIDVTGWGLSGTNKNSYCVKHINSSWNFTSWTWNDATNHRSYWAEDNNYSTGTYPENYDGWATTNNGGTDDDTNSLNYLNYNALTLKAGDVDYCFENTMNKEIAYNIDGEGNIIGVKNPAVTHLLIAATVKAGSSIQDLFRYKGEFYTKDNYIAAALNDWKAGGSLIYREVEGEESGTTVSGTSYISVTASDVEIVNLHDGKVSIQLTDAAKAKSWYTISGNTATEITDKDTTLASLFEALNTADGFKDGQMYYCVPIEHLNQTANEVGTYGVVRNHFYQLTLESIENLGTAVYDPEEEIIPNYEPETYYVAAKLNVLSWKVVEQSVNL